MTKYFLMLMVVLLCAFNASAISTIETNIDDEEKVFIVAMTDFEKEVEISIINVNGEEVYNSFHTNTTLKSKAFDVKALPSGNYKLVIKDSVKEKITPFSVTDDKVVYNEALTSLYFKPRIQQIGSRVFINANALNVSEISIVVSDNRNEELYAEKYNVESSFGKVLNLSELPRGLYSVNLTTDDGFYSQRVIIE